MSFLNRKFKNNIALQALQNNEERFAHLSLLQEALLLSMARMNRPVVIVKPHEGDARRLYQLIEELNPKLRIVYYTQEESLRVEAIAPSVVLQEKKMEAMYHLVHEKVDLLITHTAAIQRKINTKQHYLDHCIALKLEQACSMKEMIQKLIEAGYQRVERVDKPMVFSSRGGVVDVYSIQYDRPLRIEFFDTEIESLRFFDIETQRTIEQIDEAFVVSVSDMIFNDSQIEELERFLEPYIQEKETDSQIELNDYVRIDIDNIKTHYYDASLYPYFSYLKETANILDYLEDKTVIYSSIEAVKRANQQLNDEMIEFVQERVSENRWISNYLLYNRINFDDGYYFHEFEVEQQLHLPWHEMPKFTLSIEQFVQKIEKEALEGTIVLSLNAASIKQVADEMIRQKVNYSILEDSCLDRGIYIEMEERSGGFYCEDIHLSVYTDKELFGQIRKKTKYENKFKEAETLHHLSDLKRGDYVVHQQYGIGQYLGIVTKEMDGKHKDYLHVAYRNDDVLLVPLEQFTLVRKFVSKEAVSVRLSKLGSKEWSKTKERVKASVADIADRLIQLYAERKKATGFAFSKNEELHEAFDESFEYELTPDQAEAITQVYQDMENPFPMDRLLCGDVGFGKTEVAIRAAFKAVADKKQVVFLCPTTILSSQHYKTFKKRFKDFPVRIELLNRFVSEAKQKETIHDVNQGDVDILIGTHRVLSKDIKYFDLGLLVIDEEQRFGVEQKERIKEFKVSVDVLSLSATPIPRTLQMSLIGLRSLSQLNTPPSNRMPVMTYVVEKNNQLIDDIINKELSRNGQVFYLFNNIDQIYNVAYGIGMRNKAAKVSVVHGQMDREEIEDVMIAFNDNEINVLICTTIIETGIDIPNANTMIIENAQNFGLSQLYQIKGRVGRSDQLAYAYMLVPEKKQLSEIASKRLQAIKEFSQLGSGYKIAMRDLTIRGAGELLGGNQSGFIDTVGIDLYIELLQEVIREKQGLPVIETKTKVSLDLPIDGYIPEAFTDLDQQKIEIYQRIDKIRSFHELKIMMDELSDFYGSLPKEVILLLEKKRLELSIEHEMIDSLKEKTQAIELVFTEGYSQNVDGLKLFETVNKVSRDIKIKYIKNKITLLIPKSSEWLEETITILDQVVK